MSRRPGFLPIISNTQNTNLRPIWHDVLLFMRMIDICLTLRDISITRYIYIYITYIYIYIYAIACDLSLVFCPRSLGIGTLMYCIFSIFIISLIDQASHWRFQFDTSQYKNPANINKAPQCFSLFYNLFIYSTVFWPKHDTFSVPRNKCSLCLFWW